PHSGHLYWPPRLAAPPRLRLVVPFAATTTPFVIVPLFGIFRIISGNVSGSRVRLVGQDTASGGRHDWQVSPLAQDWLSEAAGATGLRRAKRGHFSRALCVLTARH